MPDWTLPLPCSDSDIVAVNVCREQGHDLNKFDDYFLCIKCGKTLEQICKKPVDLNQPYEVSSSNGNGHKEVKAR